jgi:hypothetical protein
VVVLRPTSRRWNINETVTSIDRTNLKQRNGRDEKTIQEWLQNQKEMLACVEADVEKVAGNPRLDQPELDGEIVLKLRPVTHPGVRNRPRHRFFGPIQCFFMLAAGRGLVFAKTAVSRLSRKWLALDLYATGLADGPRSSPWIGIIQPQPTK